MCDNKQGLVRRILPRVHAHFAAEGVGHKMYLVDWLLTLYTKALPLTVAARVWDNYFLVGEVFLWRTALGILRLFRKHIVTLELGNLVRFLGHLSDAFLQVTSRHLACPPPPTVAISFAGT